MQRSPELLGAPCRNRTDEPLSYHESALPTELRGREDEGLVLPFGYVPGWHSLARHPRLGAPGRNRTVSSSLRRRSPTFGQVHGGRFHPFHRALGGGGGPRGLLTSWSRRRDSNPQQTRLMRAPLYRLSYSELILLVHPTGFEPVTFTASWCCATGLRHGWLVHRGGIEPPTSDLSDQRSNLLSYRWMEHPVGIEPTFTILQTAA